MPTADGDKKAKRCTLYTPVGSLGPTKRAGGNTFHFSGRVGAQRLKLGVYRLRAIPSFAGRTGAARTTGFKLVR